MVRHRVVAKPDEERGFLQRTGPVPLRSCLHIVT
jgi:hypothetical protein